MRVIFYIIVDCRWGDWNFGECSKSCGGGVRFDTREKLIKALNGGKDCSGPSNITENCNIHDCPGDHLYSKLMPILSIKVCNCKINIFNLNNLFVSLS